MDFFILSNSQFVPYPAPPCFPFQTVFSFSASLMTNWSHLCLFCHSEWGTWTKQWFGDRTKITVLDSMAFAFSPTVFYNHAVNVVNAKFYSDYTNKLPVCVSRTF